MEIGMWEVTRVIYVCVYNYIPWPLTRQTRSSANAVLMLCKRTVEDGEPTLTQTKGF